MLLNPFPSARSGTYLKRWFPPDLGSNPANLKLDSGSQVAVAGSGPAGSFFSYFLLESAQRIGIDVRVDIYEPRDFSIPGPTGCNMCGGIISESLVQILATEGINLPPTVVQRGIDSYVLHTDVGSVRIETSHLSRNKRNLLAQRLHDHTKRTVRTCASERPGSTSNVAQ